MEPHFIHHANTERFEHLLASGTLDETQVAVVTALLQKEVEALETLTKPPPAGPESLAAP